MNSRQAFEAHILRTIPTAELDMNNGEYTVQSIQYQWLGWQACRKELSEREPIDYASFVEGEMFACVSTQDCERYEIRTNDMSPVIIRPTEE